ncbi:RHS repeat-associated core domain-containing protein [Adlercreutzia sp. R7]|uniref:RHS repeat-associated core domain-containing protein n=1 Tax=Adlercreutzia wanghongyangiae TaxID=3111451 RepID=A0ABU6IFR9_9ACTN|nr:RHS repeat-associated core domain-containing protein [Adlercreutzia sp. R7]
MLYKTKVTQPSGAQTAYGYDDDGNLVQVTDALGRITKYAYDAEGGLVSIQSPSGAVEQIVRDPAGRVTAYVDAAGAQTRYDWDELGNLVEKSYAQEGAASVLYSYDKGGLVTARSDATGDATVERDQLGRIVAETDGQGRRIGYDYDAKGNLTQVDYPDGMQVTYDYDAEGNLEVVHAPEGDYCYAYDEAASPVSLTRPDGTATTYEYDTEGRLMRLENRGASGTLISSFAYEYDGEGNPVAEESTTTASDATITRSSRAFAYDADGRLASFEEQCDGPVPAHFREDYEWDAAGNRTGVTHTDLATGAAEKTVYRYDADDRLMAEEGPQGTTSYEYDAAGNLARKAVPGAEVVEYAWAVENRLAAVRQGGRVLMAATYDGDGNKVLQSTLYHTDEIERSELPGTTASDFATKVLYGASVALPLAGAPAAADGSLKATAVACAAGGDGGRSFGPVEWFLWGATHSLAGSLAPASLPVAALGALLAEAAILGPQGGCDPVPGRGLPAPPGAAPLLTQSGVQLEELLAMAAGDWRNLPLRGAGGADTADRRAAIPVETPYVQERWELVAYVNSTVVDSVAQPAARYSDVSGTLNDVYGLGRLSTAGGTAETPVAATYLQDGLGSVSAVLDASGAVSAGYSYSPWGEVSGGAGELPAYGYNAEESTAAAGLQYLRARWYDPAGASFASRDTYLGSAPDPASLNRYAYAQGNPVAYSDPAGRAAWLKSASKTVLSAAGRGSGKLTYNRLSGSLLDPTLKRTGQKASCFTQGLPTDAHGNVVASTAPTWGQRQAAWAKSSAKSSARASPSKSGGGGSARSVRLAGRAATAQATASAVQRAFCAGASFLGVADQSGAVDWGALGHAALDALGFVPGLGAAADVANGLWYLAEGNFVDAGMSFLSAIPGVGDALGAGKTALKTGLAAADAAKKALSPSQMTQALKEAKSKVKREIDRFEYDDSRRDFDVGEDRVPHVHFADGTSMTSHGTIHDEKKGVPSPSKEASEFLEKGGWAGGPRE